MRKNISKDGEELGRVGHQIIFQKFCTYSVDLNYILLFLIYVEMPQILADILTGSKQNM